MTQSKAMIMRTLTTNYLDIGWQLIVFHEKKLLEPQKKKMVFVTTNHAAS